MGAGSSSGPTPKGPDCSGLPIPAIAKLCPDGKGVAATYVVVNGVCTLEFPCPPGAGVDAGTPPPPPSPPATCAVDGAPCRPGRGLRGRRRQRVHEFVYMRRERAFPVHDRVRPSAPAAFSSRVRAGPRLCGRGNAHWLRSGCGLFAERGVRIRRSGRDLQHILRLRPFGPLPLHDDVSRRRVGDTLRWPPSLTSRHEVFRRHCTFQLHDAVMPQALWCDSSIPHGSTWRRTTGECPDISRGKSGMWYAFSGGDGLLANSAVRGDSFGRLRGP